MRHLELVRSYLPDRTIGLIKLSAVELKTLERPWKNNEPNISCIPEGTYIVNRDETGKHRYYRVEGVANRTLIEIHVANKPSHLQGCIALGYEFTHMFDLLDSTNACDLFLGELGDEPFTLTIRSFNPAHD